MTFLPTFTYRFSHLHPSAFSMQSIQQIFLTDFQGFVSLADHIFDVGLKEINRAVLATLPVTFHPKCYRQVKVFGFAKPF